MKQQDFNAGWSYRGLGEDGPTKPVALPHDAMIHEPRGASSPGKHNIGWFACRDYEYLKHFTPAQGWQGKKLILEFEGVYHNAEVYLNGEEVGFWPYGYSNFYVDITGKLNFGVENELKVIAKNADQPNTRWYSGAGIYRPVSLWIGDEAHILLNGIRVRTVDIDPAVVEVRVRTSCPGAVKIEILDRGEPIASTVVDNRDGKEACAAIQLPDAHLWGCEAPYLYTCRVTFRDEVAEEVFGIRTISWDTEKGFSINGERVILRGACIHHDNGFLGAVCDPEAVERKIRLFKENGYNAVRSSHNPCSKAMLDACDRLGVLMMDELVDCWYIHKTKYDYVNYFEEWWKKDLTQLVEKDYNHPCVIMYSTGNEVSETAQPRGISLTREMTDFLHKLDPSRPVTCGINIFFNFLSSMGFGVYSDDKAEKEAAKPKQSSKPQKEKAVGSEFFNNLASMFGDKTMKIGATLPPCDWKTRGAFAAMDIAGYNYGIYRYKHDLKKYPNRLILGTETFCADAYDFWELAKKEPRLLGDFVWIGMDYIGETGVGRWDYLRYNSQPDSQDSGWLSSGAGRINILGRPTAEASYTKVAFELVPGPIIATRPVAPGKLPVIGAWNLTDALESWSWRGCEGSTAEVEVYARGTRVELFLNGKSLGSKSLAKNCLARFKVAYESGELKAVSYDEAGKPLRESSLTTAGEDTKLLVEPEKKTVKPGGLCYIHFRYTDQAGIWKPMENRTVSVEVEGGTLLGLGTAANYNEEGYLNSSIRTYWGEAMAIVRAGESGAVRLKATDKEQNIMTDIPIKG